MSRPFRIGLDVRAALRGPCGITRYSLELARALLAADSSIELLLYAATREGPAAAARLPAELIEHPRVKVDAARRPAKLMNWLARVPGFRAELCTGPLDVFHHTDLVYVHGWRAPEVVTIHDLAFEVSRSFHDEGFHERVRERMQRVVARARRVIVPSVVTRSDLVARWRVDPAKIAVVPLGADHALRVAREPRQDPRPAPRPWFVAVGTLEPRKNFVRLLRAWRKARHDGLDADLVHVGPRGWLTREWDEELARGDDGGRFVARGAVSDGELRAWVEDALALCYPSLYEGFGLPVAEAFALGVPVLTSNRSSTAEIASGAAELVDPEDEAALTHALLRLGSDRSRREELSRSGRVRAAAFTWARAAEATLAVDRAAAAT